MRAGVAAGPYAEILASTARAGFHQKITGHDGHLPTRKTKYSPARASYPHECASQTWMLSIPH